MIADAEEDVRRAQEQLTDRERCLKATRRTTSTKAAALAKVREAADRKIREKVAPTRTGLRRFIPEWPSSRRARELEIERLVARVQTVQNADAAVRRAQIAESEALDAVEGAKAWLERAEDFHADLSARPWHYDPL